MSGAANDEGRVSKPLALRTHSQTTDSSVRRGAEKRWSTVQARLYLAGFTAIKIEGDDGAPLYVVSKYALTRTLHSVEAVEEFAKRAGAVP
ncbi:MAG: hypothetical protein Q8R33_18590 [Burkholderiales bacterium]|nr:hypothetical protein [Burkholderiales bacterium]